MASLFPRGFFAERYFPPGYFGSRVALLVLYPPAVSSTATIGATVLSVGEVVLDLAALAADPEFGVHAVEPGTVLVLPSGLISPEMFGAGQLLAGVWMVYPEGLDNTPLPGQPVTVVKYGQLQSSFFLLF